MRKSILIILLAIFAVAVSSTAIEMNYECFGIGGGESTLAIEQHVGTYEGVYIGCFYPVPSEEKEEEGVTGPTDSWYYEQQQIENCTNSGWKWNGTACIRDVIHIEITTETIKKQGKNIVPLLLVLGYIGLVIYHRRKRRIKRRREHGDPTRYRKIRAQEQLDTIGQEEEESP